jgi:hypothetical protein
MFKKIFIAVALGALLSPVGLAFSRTGGKGLAPRGGTSYCSHKARAAGGSHPSCVTTVRTTVTKYKTVYRPVTSTRTVNHTTTSTANRTYTTTTTLGGGGTTVVVTKSVVQTFTVPGKTSTITDGGATEVVPGSTTTSTTTDTEHTTTSTTLTATITTTVTTTVTLGAPDS